MSTLDECIERAKEELVPHYIAKYCFDLAQMVNSYYGHTKILVDDELIKIVRIALLQKTIENLKQAM